MEKKRAGRIALGIILAVVLAVISVGGGACGCSPDLSDAPEFERNVIADFSKGEQPDVFFASDGWNNGTPFNSEWDASMVSYESDAAKLSISEKGEGVEGSVPDIPYYGGELRSQKWYHYGFYSIVMKPSAVEGTCTSFFTYTGPSELGADGEANPWDEIDIEFCGIDTETVQFNYFVDGVGGHEYEYKLGFDASKEYHEYGFYWEEDRITWYVDGKPVYRVVENDNTPLPSTPGRIMMNHWCGDAAGEGWMGKYTADGSSSYYQKVSTTATPIDPYVPETPSGDGEYDPSVFEDVETSKMTFFTAVPDVYAIDPATETDTVTVTYTAKGNSYNNVAADISVSDKNAFSMKITNNADTETNIRVNMIAVTAPSTNNASCNVYATYEGEQVRTDTEWGGSFFTVPANSSGYVNIWYASPIKQVQFMIDSHQGDDVTRSGNVTFSEFKFAMDDGVEFDDTVPETPETPTEQEKDISIKQLTYWGGYTISPDPYDPELTDDVKSADISYSGFDGQYAAAVVYSPTADDASNYNVFSVKVKNNGESSVVFKAFVEKTVESATTNHILSASYIDESNLETTVGCGDGYMGDITLSVGATVTVKVIYDNAVGVTRIGMYFDAHTSNYGNCSGNLNISELKLSETPVLTVPGDQTAPSDSDGIALGTVNQWGDYTITPSANGTSFRVTYAGLSQQWAGFGCDLTSEMVGTATTLSMKVKNDGTSASSFKVDVGNKPDGGDLVNKVTAASYTDASGSHDITLGSYMVTVPAGETVTLTVTFTNDNINGMNIFADSLESDYASKVGNLVFGDFTFA